MNNKNDKNSGGRVGQQLVILMIAIILSVVVFSLLSGRLKSRSTKEISYTEFMQMVDDGKVESAVITDSQIEIKAKPKLTDYSSSTIYTTVRMENDLDLINRLYKAGVVAKRRRNDTVSLMMSFASMVLPIVLMFLFINFMMRRVGGGGVMGVGKNNAKVYVQKETGIRFKDVAGEDEAKESLTEIVDFLHNPERFTKIGAKLPKGALLVGPPGTGKTLLAKAVAGEANVPFFSLSGSDFVEMFVGVGASRVRDLFRQAQEAAPCIIFIDEIDAIGKSRDSRYGGGNDEREQTLNQLLSEMDGFDADKSPVIVIAATNRPEVLDAALLRPGRFDRQVLVDKPDFKGRCDILKVHMKDVKIGKDVNIEDIARLTTGLAGADLENIINEAALLAGRKSKTFVEQADLVEAVERSIAGLEKKSRRVNPKEKKIVTYHESGHALIAELTKGAKRVTKVSVVPRGLAALGYTLNTPEENKFMMQKHELLAEVDVLLAGRAAEEVFIKEISTGASNDLERATDIIKAMVSMYGMSDVAGLMVLEKQRATFLNGGQSIKDYSDKMAEKVDEFVKALLHERYTAVLGLLEIYKGAIENMVSALYEEETIEGKRVREIIKSYEEENGLESRLVELEEEEKGKKEE